MDNRILLALGLQLMYIARPHCKVRDRLLSSIVENVKELHLEEELEDRMLARIIASMNTKIKQEKREELLDNCIAVLDYFIKGTL